LSQQATTRQYTVAIVVAAIGMAFGIGPLIYGTFSLFMLPIVAQYGWNRSQLALALAICAGFAALTHPIVGRASDRFGSKRVLLAGLLLLAASIAGLSTVRSLAELYSLHALLGVSAAGCGLVPYSRLLVSWFQGRRGLALGLAVGIGTGVGSAVIAQLTQILIAEFDWRTARLVHSALILLIPFPAVLFFMRDVPQQSHADSKVRVRQSVVTSAGTSAWEALHDGAFRKLLTMSLFGTLCLAGAVVHLVAWLVDGGMDLQLATAMFAVCALSKAFGHIAIGLLLDRVSSPRIGAVVYACAMIGIALISLGGGLLTIALGATLLGLAFGAELGLVAYFASRFWGVRSYGTIYGLLYGGSTVGSAIGPLAMGAAFDLFENYQPASLAFIALIAVCLVLNLTLNRYAYPVHDARAVGRTAT
jgi:MFS family permease